MVLISVEYRNPKTKEMEKRKYTKVGMIAGGSGITPMFQVRTNDLRTSTVVDIDSGRLKR